MRLTTKQLAGILVDATDGTQGTALKDATAGFVRLLAERGELGKLNEVIRAVDSVWKERFGAANVRIESAAPLSEKLKAAVEKLARGAEVSYEVRPELVAGARVRLDDRVIDNTVAGRAERLRQELLQTT